MHSSSPYLRQHAHNPVFWYPWGQAALERARMENKPILLSVGYSTCYWCHVMEREIFENLSIASFMNQNFVNIKVDREEHPVLDEIYMAARQLMTHQGGWPNNVFLTPELKPFYAGGTYAPDESSGRPAWPRLLEWLNYSWTTQEEQVKETAENVMGAVRSYLVYRRPEDPADTNVLSQSEQLLALLNQHHDARAGGFFQAPKFPNENYLQFLLGFYAHTGEVRALDMAALSLSKMAAGGIQDHVGCGFHRYAVDQEWYVPHFEKMLYTQAMLARAYADASVATGHAFFADVAKSILDFVSGPLTSGSGAFFSAIDAETDGVEGAYYAWTPEELEELLAPEENNFLVTFYALADIPTFPGHKHTEGKVIIARKPLDLAAREKNMPYTQLLAMASQVMNKLLAVRNLRRPPNLDDKIIVSWNGLMIDAFANAGRVLKEPRYIATARRAADFLLEHAIDNDGNLSRVVGQGHDAVAATLEDYAFLLKGLLSLHRASPDAALMDAIISLAMRADELFFDAGDGGYFHTQAQEQYVPVRVKSGDDSALPSANAIMLENLTALYTITKDKTWREKAKAQSDYFLSGRTQPMPEWSAMLTAALALEGVVHGKKKPAGAMASPQRKGDDAVAVSAALFPADAGPGDTCELIVTLDIKDGWHINAAGARAPALVPTQLDVQGDGVELVGVVYPEPLKRDGGALLTYEGLVNFTARLKLSSAQPKRPPLNVRLRFQPCDANSCQPVRDVSVVV